MLQISCLDWNKAYASSDKSNHNSDKMISNEMFCENILLDSIECVLVDVCDLNIETPFSISPSFYDTGSLNGTRDTSRVVDTDKIQALIYLMNQLKRSNRFPNTLDTRGKISIIYKNGNIDNIYMNIFFIYYNNTYYIMPGEKTMEGFKKALMLIISDSKSEYMQSEGKMSQSDRILE